MASTLYTARRLTFVLLAFFGSQTLMCSILHDTEIIKPSFFFSPLAHCALQSSYQHKHEKAMGLHLRATPFITKNFSKNLIGAGLGPTESNQFLVAPASQGGNVDSDHLIAVLTKDDNPLLQTIDETLNRPQATISFTPEHKDVGITLVLRHDLDAFFDGFFYMIEVSFVEQTRNLNTSYKNELTPTVSTADVINIHKFFNGMPQSIYDPLQTLKLSDNAITQRGCDLVQASIGYHILDKNDYRFTLIGSLQLPCGPEHSLENLFAPNIGTRHVNIGFGWQGHIKLLGNNTTTWCLSNIAMGAYNFPKAEPRIPTILNMPWAHYYEAQADKTPLYYTTTPATDLLPHAIKVKQGLSLQNSFIMSYQHKETVIDVGFSAAYREAEHNELMVPWPNNTIGITNRYLNPFNYAGASNAPSDQTFLTSGKMYPLTTGKLADSLGTQTFTLGTDNSGNPVTMTPTTAGAWAQNQTIKVINNADLAINQPTLFFYQAFASYAYIFKPTTTSEVTANIGCNIAFGQPQELLMRTYQIWAGLSASF